MSDEDYFETYQEDIHDEADVEPECTDDLTSLKHLKKETQSQKVPAFKSKESFS